MPERDQANERQAGGAARTGTPRASGRTNLVTMVIDDLREQITGGTLKIGDRLPSEAELTRQYNVSRTVIREAVSALKSDSLVSSRQGAGVFVQSNQLPANFPWGPSDRISSIIETLELRAAAEIEAAGLAAVRRSPAQEEKIIEAHQAFERAIAEGKPTAAADVVFHMAIAEATNNPRFCDFLELLGSNFIPRAMHPGGKVEESSKAYLQQIQTEHKNIADAIGARDEDAAREAMRIHLKGSQQRYRNRLNRA